MAQLPKRKCAECGEKFDRKQAKQVFCTPACKTRFWNRVAARGKTLALLMQAWRVKRSTETSKRAHAEACRLVAEWNDEDAKAGRTAAWDFVDYQFRTGAR